MEPLFSNSYINIYLHQGPPKTIEIQWLDFVPSTDFRASMRQMLHLAQLHRVSAWTADNRLIRALRTADLAWTGEEVLKPMAALGVRRLAVVESLDAMNRMGVTALFTDVIPGTQMSHRYFSTMEEARVWAMEPL
ncbi:MAG: hypothetical protein ACRYFK_13410 [Janthinobacterium lividum]